MYIYIYIYIYTCRERTIYVYIYIYVYIHLPTKKTCKDGLSGHRIRGSKAVSLPGFRADARPKSGNWKCGVS